MRKYLIVVIALLFSLGITAQIQRKVTTGKLQVTKLKNAETIGFDEKGNAFAKAFPKVDLTPINTELAKKLNAGTYTGTAQDLKTEIDSKVTASGLEKITENGKTGYRLIGKAPNNYGNIGDGAVDFSSQTTANTTRGATGDHSVAIGTDVTASGKYSLVIGKNLKSNLDYSLKIGEGEDLNYTGYPSDNAQTRFVISTTNGFTQEATNLFTVDEFGRVFVRKDFSSVCTRNQLMPWGKIQDYVSDGFNTFKNEAVEISVNPPALSEIKTPFVFKMLNQGEYHNNNEPGVFFGSTDGRFGILISNSNNNVYFLRLHNGTYEWKRVPFLMF